MAVENISGPDVVSSTFTVQNPEPREAPPPEENNTQTTEETPENNRGTRIDTYA